MAFNIFKKYPFGFGSLFFTQAFFNFSFYGLKSLFILYVIAQFSISEKSAISLFATLMALSYGTSFIGGWVADKSLGAKNTIILGGLLQASGITCLMVPLKELSFLALALISLGSGFFKPTLSSSVGMLFENPKDSAKDKAYSTFYVAMNLGSFAAPLLCGFISKTYGGYYSSLLLIIMTLVGGVYLLYEKINFKRRKDLVSTHDTPFSHPAFVGTLVVALLFVLFLLFKYHSSFNYLMISIALGSALYFGKILYQSPGQERKDILSILLYIVLFTFFCSLFEQAGSSLMLFFDKAVDRHILGIKIPSATLLSLGPVFVLICSPFLVLFYEKVLERKKPVDGFIKIGIGFLLLSISFLTLGLSCIQQAALVPLWWIVSALFIQTIGELLIVPIGFSNVSKLAPPQFRSLMMSFWLMAIAYGHYFGGFIAQFSLAAPSESESSLEHYRAFFFNLACIPCIVAIVLLLYYSLRQSKHK